MASTSHPSASSRSTSVEPMNPAPPVTITRIGSLRRRLGRWFGRSGSARRMRAPEARARASRVASAPTIVWSEAMAPDPRIARSPMTESMVSASSETTRAVVHHGPQQPRAAPDATPGAEHRAGDPCARGDDRRRCRAARALRCAPRRGRRLRPAPTRRARARARPARARRRARRPARRRAPAGTSRASRCRSSSASVAIAYRRLGSSSMRGNVSRSIETVSRSGMRCNTDGSSTYVPALIQLVGALPCGGFSTNATTSPSSRVGTTPNADGSSTLREADGGLGTALVVERHQLARSSVVSTSPLHTTRRSSSPVGREADGARGTERVVLDRVPQGSGHRSDRRGKCASNASGR